MGKAIKETTRSFELTRADLDMMEEELRAANAVGLVHVFIGFENHPEVEYMPIRTLAKLVRRMRTGEKVTLSF